MLCCAVLCCAVQRDTQRWLGDLSEFVMAAS
jgi:hypothetical protein